MSWRQQSKIGTKKMKTYSYEEISRLFGKEIADSALSSNAEPTSRLMDPAFENPAHLDKIEYACDPVCTPDNDTVQAFFYLSPDDEENVEIFNWQENAEFQIN